MHPTASPLLLSLFVLLVLVVCVSLVLGVRLAATNAGRNQGDETRKAALAIAAVLVGTGGLSMTGVLVDFSMPPGLPILVGAMLLLSIGVGVTKYGTFLAASTPLWVLVGVNSFRLPLELLMHQAAQEGVMPVQMSYAGQNYDIMTGGLALAVGAACKWGTPPLRLVRIFNVVGLVLLINVVVIAVVSMPLPIRQYMNEPANTWVAYFPFVWLPTVLVCIAALTHILILRRLASEMSLARHQAPSATR